MNARETLAKVTEGAPGWAMDADSHARFATIAHPDGAVVELRQERWGAPWVCDAGRPGSMHRREDHRPFVAVLLACVPGRDAAPEVRALFAVVSSMMNAEWGDVAPHARVGTPEPLPVGAARVDAILASLAPGPDLRENILAAEVMRLREQVADRDARWAELRRWVDEDADWSAGGSHWSPCEATHPAVVMLKIEELEKKP